MSPIRSSIVRSSAANISATSFWFSIAKKTILVKLFLILYKSDLWPGIGVENDFLSVNCLFFK